MIETIIRCYITSKDAEEIAQKLRYIEQNAKIGDDKTTKIWTLPSYGDLHTKIAFVVDQDRAYQQGLMK